MPMLRDDGPPVALSTIQRARSELAVEYGFETVDEAGRRVLLVRTPRSKPDYLRELKEAALHVPLTAVKDVKDVLFVGSEKSCRVEPVALRDRIRELVEREDAAVDEVRMRLRREYGVTTMALPIDPDRSVLVVRVPRRNMDAFAAEDVWHVRAAAKDANVSADAAVAYVITDSDHERVTGRVLRDLLGLPPLTVESEPEAAPAAPAEPTPEPAPTAAAPEPEPPAPAPAPATASPSPGIDLDDQDATLMTRSTPAPTPAPVDTPEPAAAEASPSPAPDPEEPSPAHGFGSPQDFADQDATLTTRASPRPAAPEAAEPASTPTPEPAQGPSAPRGRDLDDQDATLMTRADAAPAVEDPAPAPAPAARDEAPEPAPAPAAAPSDAAYSDGPLPGGRMMEVVEENDEYEVMVTKRSPDPVSLPRSAASTPAAEVPEAVPVTDAPDAAEADDPRPRTLVPPGPSGDNGTTVEPAVVASVEPPVPLVRAVGTADDDSAIGALREKLEAAGYEVMAAVDVMGHTFDLAAHQLEGKRILVKSHPKIDHETFDEMRRVATELGADVCLCVSSEIEDGMRLTAWGTVVTVLTPDEAVTLHL